MLNILPSYSLANGRLLIYLRREKKTKNTLGL
uniref:Uncharacterized protein n=1 Tax=Arundo donax TaxID=35708 RepID=A0A0A9AL21_ARUDO